MAEELSGVEEECYNQRTRDQIAVLATGLHQIKNGNKTFYSYVPVSVERSGEMSNFLEDFEDICNKLNI